MNRRRVLAALAVAVALPAGPRPVAAQVAGDAPAAGAYQVEVIIFRHARTPGLGPPVTRIVPGSPQAMNLADLRLGSIARRLAATGSQPLLHAGWRQRPTNPGDRRTVADPAVPGLTVSGALYPQGTLYLSLEVELEPAGPGASGVARLRETRRIRGPGLHYLDHPDFGVLASVRSLAAPPAAGVDR